MVPTVSSHGAGLIPLPGMDDAIWCASLPRADAVFLWACAPV